MTCGEGLAANSVLPAKIADLLGALAQVLSMHLKALVPEDAEYAAYSKLAAEFHDAASRMAATAEAMAGYRDLPMAHHDMSVMTSAANGEAFRGFVRLEEELLVLLRQKVEQDRKMLGE